MQPPRGGVSRFLQGRDIRRSLVFWNAAVDR